MARRFASTSVFHLQVALWVRICGEWISQPSFRSPDRTYYHFSDPDQWNMRLKRRPGRPGRLDSTLMLQVFTVSPLHCSHLQFLTNTIPPDISLPLLPSCVCMLPFNLLTYFPPVLGPYPCRAHKPKSTHSNELPRALLLSQMSSRLTITLR
jgi:hypothetical protein